MTDPIGKRQKLKRYMDILTPEHIDNYMIKMFLKEIEELEKEKVSKETLREKKD